MIAENKFQSFTPIKVTANLPPAIGKIYLEIER